MGARAMVDIEHGEQAAKNATFLVAGLAIAKGIVGWITNSAALLADALHSTVDVLTTLGTWIGLKIAKRPADERFPYGYYRAESIVAFLVAAVVIFGAVELFLDGVHRIQNPEPVKDAWLAASIAIIASITSYYISKIEGEAYFVVSSSIPCNRCRGIPRCAVGRGRRCSARGCMGLQDRRGNRMERNTFAHGRSA